MNYLMAYQYIGQYSRINVYLLLRTDLYQTNQCKWIDMQISARKQIPL